jgi:hypothetical protein
MDRETPSTSADCLEMTTDIDSVKACSILLNIYTRFVQKVPEMIGRSSSALVMLAVV